MWCKRGGLMPPEPHCGRSGQVAGRSQCAPTLASHDACLKGVRPRGLESGPAETAALAAQPTGSQPVTVLEQQVQACALRHEQPEPEVAQVPQRQRTVGRLGELDPQER